MKNKSLTGEFWSYLHERNAWWFSLIILMLLIVGLLVITPQGSILSPFIYALF
jgi:hypothetical protein